MKKLPIVAVIVLVLFGYYEQSPDSVRSFLRSDDVGQDRLASAYEQKQSDVQVGGSGVVVHILPDDNRGSRHQKFIIKLASGQKLLIAHNIDLADRIDNLRQGDTVAFYGEYEWNPRGGVVHWTHRDPGGRHEGGWLKHEGLVYQ